MVRFVVAFGIVGALLSAVGCVPVTEPVGAVEKAEPDKALAGKWSVTESNGLAELLKVSALTLDAPEVKGNPKGLMRSIFKNNDNETEMWFFLTKVGKHNYVSAIMAEKESKDPPTFNKEGEFAEWKKQEGKRYFVFRYKHDGDKLVIDCGNLETFKKLMTDEKIPGDGTKHLEYYLTPAEWLAKYFDKNDSDKVFDGTNMMELKREKK